MITQPTDFKVEIDIPQATVSPSNENVLFMISKYEPLFLSDLFGQSFAALFTAGIAAQPVDARWTALLNLPGFKTAIANYIYYYWMDYQSVQNFGTGTGKSKDTNSTNASGAKKVLRAWEEMYITNWKTLCYLADNAAIYPEYVVPKWYSVFAQTWKVWGFNVNIFTSPFWFSWFPFYRLPDIFQPLSRL